MSDRKLSVHYEHVEPITAEMADEFRQYGLTAYEFEAVLPVYEEATALWFQIVAIVERLDIVEQFFTHTHDPFGLCLPLSIQKFHDPDDMFLPESPEFSVHRRIKDHSKERFPLSQWKKWIREAKKGIARAESLLTEAEWLMFMEIN